MHIFRFQFTKMWEKTLGIAMELEVDIDAWKQGVERSANWLAKGLVSQNMFEQERVDFNWLAKVVWPLSACGRQVEAKSLLFDLTEQFLRKGRVHEDMETAGTASYALGWVVCGAAELGMPEYAGHFYTEMRRYLCPQYHGLCDRLKDVESPTYFDAGIQGAALNAAIGMKDLETAIVNADLIVEMHERQQFEDDLMYIRYHPQMGFMRNIEPDDKGFQAFRRDLKHIPFANLGFNQIGLLRLYAETGAEKYMRCARDMMDVFLRLYSDDLLTHGQNHKVAYASMLIFQHTRDEKYLDAAITIGDLMAQRVQEDGIAHGDVFCPDYRKQSRYISVRTTCDTALWLKKMHDLYQEIK